MSTPNNPIAQFFMAISVLGTACALADPPDQIWMQVPGPASFIDISVTVLVHDDAGTPLADIPIEAYSMLGSAFGFSDEQGLVTLQIRYPDDVLGHIWVTLSNGKDNVVVEPDIREAAELKFNELIGVYSFDNEVGVPIDPAIPTAFVEYVAKAPITLSGRLQNMDGTPYSGGIGSLRDRASSVVVGEAGQDGSFSLLGIEKDSDVFLLVHGLGVEAHLLEIPASSTAADYDMGVVVLDESERDAELVLSLTNNFGLMDFPEPAMIGTDVTLVSITGEIYLGLQIDDILKTANIVSEYLDDEPGIMIPAGEYYVSPGTIGYPTSLNLIDCVKQGLQAELDAAGVPKITVVAGETTEVTIDALAAYNAVYWASTHLTP